MSAQAVTMPKAVRVIPAKPEYSGKSNADFRPKRVAAYCRVWMNSTAARSVL